MFFCVIFCIDLSIGFTSLPTLVLILDTALLAVSRGLLTLGIPSTTMDTLIGFWLTQFKIFRPFVSVWVLGSPVPSPPSDCPVGCPVSCDVPWHPALCLITA